MSDELLPIPQLELPEDPLAGKYRVAMIIDGVVHQVLQLEPKEAAKYLSEPVFVQIPKMVYVEQGFKYDGEKFSDK